MASFRERSRLLTHSFMASRAIIELDVDFTENRLSDNIYDPDYTKTLPKVEEENLEEIFQHVKIIFLGAAGVGKTSIIKQFVSTQFSEYYEPTRRKETYFPTIFMEKKIYEVKITDIPAIPYFPLNSEMEWTDYRFYGLRHASAYVLVFDLSDKETFQHIRSLREQICDSRNSSEIPMIVVGNKLDKLPPQTDTAQRFAEIISFVKKRWGCPYVECSAKRNYNILQVFEDLMSTIQAAEGKSVSPSPSLPQSSRNTIHNANETNQNSHYSCSIL